MTKLLSCQATDNRLQLEDNSTKTIIVQSQTLMKSNYYSKTFIAIVFPIPLPPQKLSPSTRKQQKVHFPKKKRNHLASTKLIKLLLACRTMSYLQGPGHQNPNPRKCKSLSLPRPTLGSVARPVPPSSYGIRHKRYLDPN